MKRDPHHLGKATGLYKLDENRQPVPVEDALEWARWFAEQDRRKVACTELNGWLVSTVFLGIDHNFFGGEPLLFETMIFKVENFQELEDFQERYSTWAEAIRGHEKAVTMIRGKIE